MAWLAPGAADDILRLQPETYALWRLTLSRTWRIVDPELLELVRGRIAHTYGRAGEDARPSSELERDALDYVDQFMIDQNGLADELKERLAVRLAPRTLHDFTFAAWAHQADQRARALLEIGPDAGERERLDGVPEDDGSETFPFPGVDADLAHAIGRFGNDACRRSLVDPTTSEVCRLRNAAHQVCHY